jgi:acyl carrier protein
MLGYTYRKGLFRRKDIEVQPYDNTRLSDIDYLDSLDNVEIFVKIERLYGVLIPDDELVKLSRKTIKEIADHVQAKIPV